MSPTAPQPELRPIDSLGGCFTRLVSTFGVVGMIVCAIMVARGPGWTLGVADAVFWLVVLATLTATWFDRTRERRPGPGFDAGRRLAGIQFLLAVGIWLGAHSVQVFQ